MIVFVQPVSGHASNWNGSPPSCGITVMLRIIGVGSACPSRTSLTHTNFCRDVYSGWGGYEVGGGSYVWRGASLYLPGGFCELCGLLHTLL